MAARADPYQGWLRSAADGADLLDDRSDSFQVLDSHFGRSGRGRMTAGGVSLRPWMPPIWNQGDLQSCTAHATAAAAGFQHPGVQLSRLQLYYLARGYENATSKDTGARLHNAIRALRDYGAAAETLWPYDEARMADPPDHPALATAKFHKIQRYARLAGAAEFRQCLRSGHPFVIGMHHTDAFWSDESRLTGLIATPGPEEPTRHAHAVCVIGYEQPCRTAQAHLEPDAADRGELHYEVRNSVGPEWGDAGHFWVAASYLENTRLAGDAWTIRR